MFRQDTTFVIGAGASAEFKLPVGTELAEKIRESARIEQTKFEGWRLVDRDLDAVISVEWSEIERKDILNAMLRIHTAIDTSVSIDAFIHRNRENRVLVQMGKALIAWNIAKAESECLMQPYRSPEYNQPFNRDALKETWISKFMRILFDGVSDPDQIAKQVKIVCFNYDRCIEYYLVEAVRVAFDVGDKIAHDIVGKMEIIHPYGYLGKFPVVPGHPNVGECDFGADVARTFPLRRVSEKIRTYTEQAHDPVVIRRIHNAINSAHNLAFMGFGFNNQNLDMMRILNGNINANTTPKNVYTSGMGVSIEEEETLKRRITNLYADYVPSEKNRYFDKIRIAHGKTCSQLIDMQYMNLNSFRRKSFYVNDHDEGLPVSFYDIDEDNVLVHEDN